LTETEVMYAVQRLVSQEIILQLLSKILVEVL